MKNSILVIYLARTLNLSSLALQSVGAISLVLLLHSAAHLFPQPQLVHEARVRPGGPQYSGIQRVQNLRWFILSPDFRLPLFELLVENFERFALSPHQIGQHYSHTARHPVLTAGRQGDRGGEEREHLNLALLTISGGDCIILTYMCTMYLHLCANS